MQCDSLITLDIAALLLSPTMAASTLRSFPECASGQTKAPKQVAVLTSKYNNAMLSPEHPERKSSSCRHRETPIYGMVTTSACWPRLVVSQLASPKLPSAMVCPTLRSPSDRICPAEIKRLAHSHAADKAPSCHRPERSRDRFPQNCRSLRSDLAGHYPYWRKLYSIPTTSVHCNCENCTAQQQQIKRVRLCQ
jgi:hypothetical protein